VTGDQPVSPERLERARRLVEGAGRVKLPYPSREAVDPIDGACLYAVELLSDPEWIARHWLPPDDPEETR
jgi:hypothetical protein